MPKALLAVCALLLALGACADAEVPPAVEAPVVDGVVTIRPDGQAMRYAQTAFTVRAGQPVRLVFENTATGAAMQHNVVVLRPGTDPNLFGRTASASGRTGYVPVGAPEIVAHTAMAAPGERVEVAFTVPAAPGEYPFVCTFPGHYLTMRGVMRVVAA